MKLSAPPPPPPESPDPGPQPTPEPEPDARVSAPTPGEPAAPAAPVAAKPAAWPAWFGAIDAVLVGLAVVLGFMVASFAARNTDLWVHLGAGRMLTTGEYRLGSDPFSYTAADRPWVNHNWLFDLGAYLLYRDDGLVLVLAKALAVGAAVGLLIGLRRPGHALWPWAVLAVFAVVAAAPRLTLNPVIGSVLFLALTLFLVFRVSGPPGSWRLPVAVGVTFWLWANVDQWFFIGPAALALLLVGDLVRRYALQDDQPAAAADDPLGPLPDPKTLAKALAVGVVACMLNPHHVRVWELPLELVGAAGVEDDPRLRVLVVSPLNALYRESEYLGYNVNGLCYAALLAAGVYFAFLAGAVGRFVGPPLDIDPLPLPHALLWVGFAALSLLTMFAVPFLAVVTVPLVASRLNLISARVALGSRADRRARLILTASGSGRVVSAVGALALCVVAWAGWLHAPASCWWENRPVSPAYDRPVAWTVEPDPGLKRAAEWLAATRADGRLPPDVHGLITSVELANYCAWFAPQEKVFLNGRLNHHRPELPEFVRVRRALGLFPGRDAPADPQDGPRVLDRHHLRYVVLATGTGDGDATRNKVIEVSLAMLREWKSWRPWYLDGRTTVFGWQAGSGPGDPATDRLGLDPARLAFGPGVDRLPATKADRLPPPPTPLDDFVRRPRPASPAVDEALRWLEYREVLARRIGIKTAVLQYSLARLTARVPVRPLPQDYVGLDFEKSLHTDPDAAAPWPPEGALPAASVLALRAARRAIADNPDHPDGYYALGRVYAEGGLPVSDAERAVGIVTAYRQCLSRLPPPEEFRPGVYVTPAFLVAQTLAMLYLGESLPTGQFQGLRVDAGALGQAARADLLFLLPGTAASRGRPVAVRVPPQARRQLPPGAQQLPGQYLLPLDLAQDTLGAARKYALAEIPSGYADRDAILKGIENRLKLVDSVRQKSVGQFRDMVDRPQTRVRDRFEAALATNLVGEAIKTVKDVGDGLDKEFGQDTLRVLIQTVALQLAVGRLEDASADLAGIKELLDSLAAAGTGDRADVEAARRQLRDLEYLKLVLEGDYATAGDIYEQLNGRFVEAPLPDEVLKFDRRRFLALDSAWPMVRLLGATEGPVGVLAWSAIGQGEYAEFAQYRQYVSAKAQAEAEFFFRRGFLSLVEGDVAAAKVRFRQARRSPPPDWGLPEFVHPQADGYLRAIEAGERPAAGP